MKIEIEASFDRDYARLPNHIQERVDSKLALFLQDSRHPSLGVKKMEGWGDVWEGRITQGYRFTFQIVGDTYRLRRIGTHDILRHP
jgi:mRNA-degrading endonuclease RelE of RelBE toxin-antitoxin system